MKKIIEKIKKKEDVFIFLLIAFSLIGITLNVKLDASDELWNFQNIYKMYNGFVIYKDANVICTPLFFYIGNLLFRVLGANFFVFRIYSIVIYSVYIFVNYKILVKLKINKKISYILVILLMIWGNYTIPRVMANYNYLAIDIVLIGILLILNKKDYFSNKNIIIQSILAFCILMTKQNIGVLYILCLTILIFYREKHKTTKILKMYGLISAYTVVFIISLLLKGNINEFFNFAILGIKQFGQKNIYLYNMNFIVAIAILMIDIITGYVFIKKVKIQEDRKINLIVLEIMSLGMFFTIFPIVNMSHTIMGIDVEIILLIYIISLILENINIDINTKIDNIKCLNSIVIILSIAVITMSTLTLNEWAKETIKRKDYYDYCEPFFGSVVLNEQKNNINNITEYINNKSSEGVSVIIFSAKAALYMIPLKESNGYYDLPFYGNFGNLTEMEIIEEFKNKENVEILLQKDEENMEWQESKQINRNLKKELKKVGEIEEFEIYVNN